MRREVRLSLTALMGLWLFLQSVSSLFAVAIGDRVQVTSVTNVRSCAGTSCSILAEAPVGSQGVVLSGPTTADSFTWWRIDWDSLPTGWSIQSNIAVVAVPSVSSISPTAMTADGVQHTLTINGSNFQSGNRVQFKWGVGSGSGTWTTGSSPNITSSTQMTVSMNPGTVNDTIFVRVCRSSSATSTSDCSSGTQSVTVTATVPVPSVSSISPTAMTADGVQHTLTINGSNFQSGNRVQFKWGVGSGSGTWTTGSSPNITSSTQMTVSMNPGTVNDTIFVRVCRSSSATSTSDCSSGTQSITVTATVPVPSVSSISPTAMTADGVQHTLTINGSNFQSGNRVQFKWGVGTGSGTWTTGSSPNITSSTQMTVSMNPGTVNDTIFVRVCRSSSATSTSDCSSGTQSVTVTATVPVPSVSSISPTAMTADGVAHTLTINGSSFQSGNVVQFKWGVGTGSGTWNTGNSPSISSSSQMTVSMNPGTVNDTIFVRVCRSASATSTSDCSSGTQSVTVTATVPVPSVSSISPTTMTADGVQHTLTINGSNFQSGNRVQFKWGVGSGSGVWTTGNSPNITSSSQMTVSMNPGTVNDTIFVRVCRSASATSTSDCSSGTQSVAVTTTVPVPTVSSVSPTTMTADGVQHTLTINGGNFQSGNRVQFKWGVGTGSGTWNTGNSPNITGSTQMTVSMNPGTVNDTIFVRVCRSASATTSSDCSSGTQSVAVTTTAPAPSVSSISPTAMTADGVPHTLTINGGNFQSGNRVQFKWGVGTGSGMWNTGNAPNITNSSQMTVSMNPGTVNDTIFIRVCRSATATTSSDCSAGTQSVVVTAATATAPSVSSISPTAMTANGVPQTLTIRGGGFQTSNIVQFKRVTGPGSGVWNTGNAPMLLSSTQMTVNLNPGTVNDTIYTRVCRSSSATSASDCSSGIHAVTVRIQVSAPPQWVALGDSFSSGEGAGAFKIDRTVDGDFDDPGEDTDFVCPNTSPNSTCPVFIQNFCHRSANAYSQIASYSQEAGYTNLKANEFHACSGAVTKNVWPLNEGGVGQTKHGQPYVATDNVPQLEHSNLGSADMVTLTIGGNDAMFADILKKCFLYVGLLNPDCSAAPYGFFPSQTWEEFIHDWIEDEVRSRVRLTLQQTCASSPGATIYLLGYPKLFPQNGAEPNCTNELFNSNRAHRWSVNEQLWLNRVANHLNRILSEEANDAGAYFVDMYHGDDDNGLFKNHEICGSGEAYFNAPESLFELLQDRLFHPNATGYSEGYRKTLMKYLHDHPPHGTGAPNCIATSASDANDPQEEESSRLAGLTIPTIGRIEVTAPTTCLLNAFPHDQQISVSATDFAPSSTVSFEIATENGIAQLGSATADGSGVVRAQLTLPAPVDLSEPAQIEANGTGSNGLFRKTLASFSIGPSTGTDTDFDGVEDACDVCPLISNPGQEDQDLDGLGDACDVCPLGGDGDDDGLCDISDSCPFDAANDADADGLCGGEPDNCSEIFNPGQEDSDLDFVGDACDRFPGIPDNQGIFRDGFETGDLSSWSVGTVPSGPSAPYQVDAHTVALWHFNESSGMSVQDEAGSHTGEVQGTPSTTAGLFGNARVLGAVGSGNYVTVPDAADLDGFPQITVEAWIFPTGGSANLDLIGKGQHTGDSPSQVVFPYELSTASSSPGSPSGLRYSFFVGGSGAGGGIEAASTITHPFNQWLYLAGTYDGHRARIYVNGELEAESPVRDGFVLTNASPLFINNQQYPSGPIMIQSAGGIPGVFDEIRISKIARSASEISAAYATLPAPAGYVGLWQGTIATYTSELEITQGAMGLSVLLRMAGANQPEEALSIVSISTTRIVLYRPDDDAQIELSLAPSGGLSCLDGAYLENGTSRPASLCR